jgi:hypothetical protein
MSADRKSLLLRSKFCRISPASFALLAAATVIGVFFLPQIIDFIALPFDLSYRRLGIMFPPGIIAWAKAAHSELDPWDESMWWIPRLVGSGLIAISIVIAWILFVGVFIRSDNGILDKWHFLISQVCPWSHVISDTNWANAIGPACSILNMLRRFVYSARGQVTKKINGPIARHKSPR